MFYLIYLLVLTYEPIDCISTLDIIENELKFDENTKSVKFVKLILFIRNQLSENYK